MSLLKAAHASMIEFKINNYNTNIIQTGFKWLAIRAFGFDCDY